MTLEEYIAHFKWRIAMIDKSYSKPEAEKRKSDIIKMNQLCDNPVKKQACDIVFQK